VAEKKSALSVPQIEFEFGKVALFFFFFFFFFLFFFPQI